MTAPSFYDLIVMSVVGTPGIGDITLGAPKAPYLGFSTYSPTIADSTEISYSITDGVSNSEIGTATYRTPTASSTTYGKLTGRTVTKSTNSNSAIDAGAASVIRCTPRAEDLVSNGDLVLVSSVFGRTGVVVSESSDFAAQSLPLPWGYLAGLQLSNDGSNPTTVLDIAAGVCRDRANASNIVISSMTKSAAGAWASGSGSHGMGNGLTIASNTWYHVLAIINAGAADVYFDTSETAVNAPSGTTAYRRIGSFLTDVSGNIGPFTQNGDEFLLVTPILNENAATPPSSATAVAVSVPPNVKVNALLAATLTFATAGNAIGLYSPDQTGFSLGLSGSESLRVENSGEQAAGMFVIGTNTSQQINVKALSTNGTYYLTTQGYIDRRGRDD
jgi:hypothetical protein